VPYYLSHALMKDIIRLHSCAWVGVSRTSALPSSTYDEVGGLKRIASRCKEYLERRARNNVDTPHGPAPAGDVLRFPVKYGWRSVAARACTRGADEGRFTTRSRKGRAPWARREEVS